MMITVFLLITIAVLLILSFVIYKKYYSNKGYKDILVDSNSKKGVTTYLIGNNKIEKIKNASTSIIKEYDFNINSAKLVSPGTKGPRSGKSKILSVTDNELVWICPKTLKILAQDSWPSELNNNFPIFVDISVINEEERFFMFTGKKLLCYSSSENGWTLEGDWKINGAKNITCGFVYNNILVLKNKDNIYFYNINIYLDELDSFKKIKCASSNIFEHEQYIKTYENGKFQKIISLRSLE